RFQNRVRYLAMRQRASQEKESESPVIRMIRDHWHITDETSQAPVQQTEVPEQLLVAFAAIEQYEPAWIRDEVLFRKIAAAAERPEEPRYTPVLKARLESDWDKFRSDLEPYRKAYLDLGSELKKEENEPGRITGNRRLPNPGQRLTLPGSP